jgi:hypothetical protein
MSLRPLSVGLFLAISLVAALSVAQAKKEVRQITIQSSWGGLGTSQNSTITILRVNGKFKSDGRTVSPKLIDALVVSLNAPPIAEPETANLGITSEWLAMQIPEAEKPMAGKFTDALPAQKRLFEKSFTDLSVMQKVLFDLFSYTNFDDNPFTRVEVQFQDGSALSAFSNSYFTSMIPWKVNSTLKTYNAQISRALSALLPEKASNKERLVGQGLSEELATALMRRSKHSGTCSVLMAVQART